MGRKTAKTTETNQESLEIKNVDVKIRWYAVAIFFLLLTIIFFWDVIFGGGFLWEDFAEYFYPAQNFAASSKELPFWNPFTFGGMPFLADLQVGYFYPVYRLFSLFVGSNGLVPVSVMQAVVVLHFFIALCSMYALTRKLKISILGSIISAVSYGFSFSLVLQAIHPMILAHLSWFPLVVMFLYAAVTEGDLKSGILGGLIFGMSVLSGHPQTLLYEGIFLGAFALWYFIDGIGKQEYKLFKTAPNPEQNTNTHVNIIKVILAVLLVFVIGAGIFQIQYQHTNEFTDNTLRSEMTYDKASEGSLDLKQIFAALVPNMFGYDKGDRKPVVHFQLPTKDSAGRPMMAPYYYYWETGFYFGIVAVLLALYGFISDPKQKHTKFLIGISVFGFLFALGSNGFLFNLVWDLPGINKFRFPSRMMFYVTFSFAVMAGMGFDRIILKNRDRKEAKKIIISSAIVIIGTILVASGLFTPDNMQGELNVLSNFASRAIILIIISLLVILTAFHDRASYAVAGTLLVFVSFVDLFLAGADFNNSPEDFSKKYETEISQFSGYKPKYPNELFRVSMRHYDFGIMSMQRNGGMMSKIMLVEGYNPLVMDRYELPRPTREDRNKLWNVKYEIAVDSQARNVYFRERMDDDFLPRAWMVGKAEIVPTDEIVEFMNTSEIDYRKVVVLEENINYKLPETLDTNAKVTFEKYEANKMSIKVASNTGGMLVLSEVYYPAWKAKLDGAPITIHRANYNFRAVYVPAGEHVVSMEYASEAYASGKLVTLTVLVLSLLGLGAILIIEKRRRKS